MKTLHFLLFFSLTNEKKDSINNLTQKHLLYKQFVAWSCDGCSVVLIIDYIHNPVYQELTDEEKYFTNKSNERVSLDIRASTGYTDETEKFKRNDSKITLYITLKDAATKKLR